MYMHATTCEGMLHTHTPIPLCGAVLAGGGAASRYGVTHPHTDSDYCVSGGSRMSWPTAAMERWVPRGGGAWDGPSLERPTVDWPGGPGPLRGYAAVAGPAAGGAPRVPGRSVSRSATRATVSSCASGVSGQRSGCARAMSCRTVRSRVARSAATWACATWRQASVWTWTTWVARAWTAWTTPVRRVCTRG